jgi:predicted nucleic acid-binding protein
VKFVGLDTNFLAYLAGVDRGALDKGKINASRALMAQLAGRVCFIVTTQALGELFVVLTRAGASRQEAQAIVETLSAELERVGITPEIFEKALEIAVSCKLQIWDSIILSASAASGCSLLLSEDMQHGFRVGSITIVNPFVEATHPQLSALFPEA